MQVFVFGYRDKVSGEIVEVRTRANDEKKARKALRLKVPNIDEHQIESINGVPVETRGEHSQSGKSVASCHTRYSGGRKLLSLVTFVAWLLVLLAVAAPLMQMSLGVHVLPAFLSAVQYGLAALSLFALVAVASAIFDMADNSHAIAQRTGSAS